jgi:MFS family permease
VDLEASTQQLQWFVNAYVLSFACLLMTGAALGDRFGRRRVFVIGIVVFTLASAGCGLADSSAQLITYRAVQGFGAAAVMPLSLTLLSQAVPERLRGLALGLWSGISGLAVAMGPVVGGAVVDGLDWRWIFWINVPVGVVAVPLILLTLRESSLPGIRLDLIGMVLAAAGLCAVVWGIVHGDTDGWTSAKVLGAFLGGAVLLAAFVAWEARVPEPMLPLSFYRVRAFTLTNVVSAAMYFGVFGSLFLLAQYLQMVPQRTPFEAGVRTLAWTLMPMFVAPVAGLLSDRVGGGRLMALGLFLQGVGLGWINVVADIDTPYSSLVAPMSVWASCSPRRPRSSSARSARSTPARPPAPTPPSGRSAAPSVSRSSARSSSPTAAWARPSGSSPVCTRRCGSASRSSSWARCARWASRAGRGRRGRTCERRSARRSVRGAGPVVLRERRGATVALRARRVAVRRAAAAPILAWYGRPYPPTQVRAAPTHGEPRPPTARPPPTTPPSGRAPPRSCTGRSCGWCRPCCAGCWRFCSRCSTWAAS